MALNKKEREDKLVQWLEMNEDEKRNYNGYSGFLRNELFKNNNLFMNKDKDKLKKRIIKEEKFRGRRKLNMEE